VRRACCRRCLHPDRAGSRTNSIHAASHPAHMTPSITNLLPMLPMSTFTAAFMTVCLALEVQTVGSIPLNGKGLVSEYLRPIHNSSKLRSTPETPRPVPINPVSEAIPNDIGGLRSLTIAAEAAERGCQILAAKARIVGGALFRAVHDSAVQLEKADVAGAVEATRKAIAQAELESAVLDTNTSSGVKRAYGFWIAMLFLVICWAIESVISNYESQQTSKETAVSGKADQDPALINSSDKAISPNFVAIDTVRFFVTWHVVCGNFYQPGVWAPSGSGMPYAMLARWAQVGFPLFIAVSGFLNTYAKMVSGDRDKVDDFFWSTVRKISPWYPMYVMSLTLCALQHMSAKAEDWSHFLANILLINGLIWTDKHYPYFTDGWFLCWLTVYLMASSPFYHILVHSHETVYKVIFFITWLACIPFSIFTWFFPAEAIIIMVQYWGAFLFGQALACWMVRFYMRSEKLQPGAPEVWKMRPQDDRDVPLLVRYGVTISYVVFAILVFSFPLQGLLPVLRKPIEPLLLRGGLLPLFGILILGLAYEADPLAKLMTRRGPRWLGKLALTTFLFQYPVHMVVEAWTGRPDLSWPFVGVLMAVSIVTHVALEVPLRRVLGMRAK